MPEVLKVGVEGEIRLSLFLDVHGRSLHVFLSGFLFVNVCWYSLKLVGVPVNIRFSVRFRDSKAFRETLRYAHALVKPVRA